MAVAADEHQVARRLAEAAGELLLDLRGVLDDPAADLDALRAQGDRRSHELLLAELRKAFPDDAVLSEEGADDAQRSQSSRLWIVDPLDGTREFGERGRTDWAVHVALAIDGQPVVGAVAMPALGLTLGTRPPPQLSPRPPGSLRIAVSRTRPPDIAISVASALAAATVPMGSAGAKVVAVMRGEVDAYIHDGGQWEWDSAAPVAVALAAGLHASRLDGRPLVYNQPRPWLPDLLVCQANLAPRILQAARDGRAGMG